MRLSIRAVLIVGIIGVQFVTVSAILGSNYATTQRALLQHARDLMSQLSIETIARSEQFLEPARGVADLTQRLANNDVLKTNDVVAMERYFFEQLQIYRSFSGLYFGAHDGSFVFVRRINSVESGQESFSTKIITVAGSTRRVELIDRRADFSIVKRWRDPDDPFDPRLRPWFRKALQKGGLTWTDPYIFFTSQRPGISATSPVIDEKGSTRGAVGVDMKIDVISSFLRGLKIGKSGSAFILNRNGDVIAYPDSERIKQPKADPREGLRFTRIDEINDPLAQAAYQSLNHSTSHLGLDGPKFTTFDHVEAAYLAVFTPFLNSSWPWVMAIYVPEDDFLGVLKKNTLGNVYIAIGIGVVACVVGFLVWRSIARPMRQISDDANTLRSGNFENSPSTQSIYREIQETADTFREMAIGLRERQSENVRLRILQSELMDSMSRSSLGQFASAVAHELNQPLAAISTYLQVIGRISNDSGNKNDDMIGNAAEKAREQAERAGTILKSLREIVETGESRRSIEHINQVVDAAIELGVSDLSVKGVEVRQILGEGLPPVQINRVQIQQVILNLVRNGVEAMSATDTRVLTVTTSLTSSGMVEISVSDTGTGLSNEVSDRLFEPMVTSKPDGMGVGLSISRSIVESHGGRLIATGAPGGGMVFQFTIPASTVVDHKNVC